MKIIIDADACPVTRIAVEIAKKHGLECITVSDTSHFIDIDDCTSVTVDKGADSADCKVAALADSGDIVVTQDYGLATLCLAKNCRAINQNGWEYTSGNIDGLLYSRYVSAKIRKSGGRTKSTKKRTETQDRDFISLLTSIIENT